MLVGGESLPEPKNNPEAHILKLELQIFSPTPQILKPKSQALYPQPDLEQRHGSEDFSGGSTGVT